MRIAFASTSHPERIAKKLKKLFAERGHQVPLSDCREALSRSWGYRGWNDVLANCTGEPDYVDAEAWVVETVPRMARELNLAPDGVREDLGAIASLLSPVKVRKDWPQRMVNIAANLATLCKTIVSYDQDGYRGFTATMMSPDVPSWLPKDAHEVFTLAADHDGRVLYRSNYEKAEFEGQTASVRLSVFINVLSRRSNAVKNKVDLGDGYKLVLGTLKRIDAEGMERLKGMTVFVPELYDRLRGLPVGANFEALSNRLPYLKGLVHALAESRNMDGEPDMWQSIFPEQKAVEELVADKRGDTMTALVDIIEDHITAHLPWMTSDRSEILATLERVGKFSATNQWPLTPRKLAYLSFVPPQHQDTIKNDGSENVFKGLFGIGSAVDVLIKEEFIADAKLDLRLVFKEIDTEFGGNVADFYDELFLSADLRFRRSYVIAEMVRRRFDVELEEIRGKAAIAKAAKTGEKPKPLGEWPVTHASIMAVRKHLLPLMAAGKGLYRVMDDMDWKRPTSGMQATPWQRMLLSSALPPAMRRMSSVEILKACGMADFTLLYKDLLDGKRPEPERLVKAQVVQYREGPEGEYKPYSWSFWSVSREKFGIRD